MALPPQLVQFLGSLAAILALAGIALWLKLGPAPRFADEATARDAARAADDGFEPVEIALDNGGAAALARDAAGRVMVLKRHGTHFAARLLGPGTRLEREGDVVVAHTGERRFGTVRLALADASAWVQRESDRSHA